MKKVYYRLDKTSVSADVIPYYENGEFKLFYLNDYRDIQNHGEGCPWYFLTTKDLVNYVEKGIALERGKESEQDLYVFTGSLFVKDGLYYIYYTGHNPHLRAKGLPEQKVLRATSKDLVTWEKDRNFVFEAPEFLEMHDFRDPFIFYDEDLKEFKMLLAAREKSDAPYFTKGITVVASSKDFNTWTVEKEPYYAPHAYFTHECPDLFKMGDWWYLIFSEFTDKICTTYRMSKTPYGPWYTPKNNTFSNHAYYAAKTAFDGKRRILFGWNPIKNREVDDEYWQWGGNIVPLEIVQEKDGTLSTKCPQEILDTFNETITFETGRKVGNVHNTNKSYLLGDDGTTIQMFSKTPDIFKLEINITPKDDRGDFGIILNSDENLDKFYKIKFEPRFNRVIMDRLPRRDGNLHGEIDTERYVEFEPNKTLNIKLIVQESVLEVFVNDKVTMSARMFNKNEGYFGIYTNNTTAEFHDIILKE